MMLTTDKERAFIGTNSGRIFHPFAPRPDEVYIPDVIHALANKIRWNGHITPRYTVAQHSVEVMRHVERHGGNELEQFKGLMHDTAEAYCVDMPKPIKVCMPSFCDLEDGIWRAICEAHEITPDLPSIVHKGDKWQLFREAAQFFPEIPEWVIRTGVAETASEDRIGPIWGYEDASAQFRMHYRRLYAAISNQK